MDIRFNCDKCGQPLEIDEAGAGQLVDCPKCGTPFSVPLISKAVSPSVLSMPPSSTHSPDNKRSNLTIKLLIAVVVAVVVGVFGKGWFVAVDFWKKQQSPESVRGTLAYLDVRYGFRDLNFEQDISEFKGMRQDTNEMDDIWFIVSSFKNGPGVQVYVRDSDELLIGSAKLFTIKYFFYKGKLMAVGMGVVGEPENFTNTEGAFRALYGEGEWHFNQDSLIRAQIGRAHV